MPEEVLFDASVQTPKVYLLTQSVYDVFTQRYGLGEIHSFSVLNHVLSQEDIAELLVVRDLVMERLKVPIKHLLESDAVYSEVNLKDPTYTRTVCLMQKTDLCQTSAHRFLNKATPLRAEPCFKLVTLKDRIYIVVGQGFLEFLGENDPCQVFFSEVMRTLYGAARIDNVNCTEWYSKYVQLLCS